MERLSVRYGPFTAVNQASFAIGPNEVVALIGPNGAGKTSLLNAISGLVPAKGGTVRIGGGDVSRLATHRRVGFGVRRTFQHARLSDNLNVLQNVLLGATPPGSPVALLAERLRPVVARRAAALREVAASGVLDELNLAAVARLPAASISFGQKKMVDLARSLIGKPKLLLMDEPTAGLSQQEIGNLADVLQRFKGSMAMLVVAHHMQFVSRIADRVICLVGGQIIAEGPPAEVQTHPQVVAAYLGQP